MEIPNTILHQMQTTRVPIRQVSSETVDGWLGKYGWLREIAGDADYEKAVKAICTMYATGRGLFVTGEVGCGKTQLLRTIQKFMGIDSYSWYYCKEQEDMQALRPEDCDALHGTVILDDIGSEEILKEYGNTVDVVGDFIQRYHYRGRGRLLATTNLNSEQINKTYGGRTLDRILEMCVVLKLDGKSKRQMIVF